jgi:hypothetical protein
VHILQCRPQTSRKEQQAVELPERIPEEDLILQTTDLVPHGVVSGIRYVVYVDPDQYRRTPSYTDKLEIARVIGRLNQALSGETFILIGPGRWGSSDVDLGVKVTYMDIYNAKVLVEISNRGGGMGAEPSYGTHFFQDLVEAGIYPLPIIMGNKGARLNTDFLNGAPNQLATLLPNDAEYTPYVQVLEVPSVAAGRTMEIVMNDEQERAAGYLKGKPTPSSKKRR